MLWYRWGAPRQEPGAMPASPLLAIHAAWWPITSIQEPPESPKRDSSYIYVLEVDCKMIYITFLAAIEDSNQASRSYSLEVHHFNKLYVNHAQLLTLHVGQRFGIL